MVAKMHWDLNSMWHHKTDRTVQRLGYTFKYKRIIIRSSSILNAVPLAWSCSREDLISKTPCYNPSGMRARQRNSLSAPVPPEQLVSKPKRIVNATLSKTNDPSSHMWRMVEEDRIGPAIRLFEASGGLRWAC